MSRTSGVAGLRRSRSIRRRTAFPLLVGGMALYCTSAMAAENDTGVTYAIPVVIGLAVGIIAGAAGVHFLAKRSAPDLTSYNVDERKVFSATRKIGTSVLSAAALGGFVVIIACYGVASESRSVAALFGADMLVAAAAAGVGALFGFIFGIPRTLDPASRAAVAGAAAQGGPAAASNAVLAANTNLERVSDWLTTLLIGATLVQIKEIPGWITSLATYLGDGNGITNQKIVPFIAVYFFGLAFLGIYLITRLYLTTALTDTLGMLTGSGAAADVSVLKTKLSSASASSDPDTLLAALVFYKHWPSSDQQVDPDLNASLARVLAKYLGTGKADDTTGRLNELKMALKNAAADRSLKAQLLADFTNGALTTGDKVKDAELSKLLN